MTTPRKPREPRLCACGCGENVPLDRRPQARYVDATHKVRQAQRDWRARRVRP